MRSPFNVSLHVKVRLTSSLVVACVNIWVTYKTSNLKKHNWTKKKSLKDNYFEGKLCTKHTYLYLNSYNELFVNIYIVRIAHVNSVFYPDLQQLYTFCWTYFVRVGLELFLKVWLECYIWLHFRLKAFHSIVCQCFCF